MGESELARRFVHTYKEQYLYALWFDAESKESIEVSFLNALAALLGLTSSFRDKAGGLRMNIEEIQSSELAQRLFHMLAMHFPTPLLIYDDVREKLEPKPSCGILRNYMPWDFFGDLKPLIVLTFQLKHACSEEVKIIQVERLTEVESIELFRSWWEI